MVKKLLIMLFVMLLGISAVNAGQLEYDQDQNLDNYNRYQGGNSLLLNVVGSVSDINGTPNSVNFGNESYTYDAEIEFSSFRAPVLISFQNIKQDAQLEFLWNTGGVGVVQSFNLSETGFYVFRYVPSDLSEQTTLYINLVDPSDIIIMEYMEEKQRGASQIMDTGINAILEIVVIVVAFWTLFYYLAIFLIVLAGISLFIGLGFKVVEWAERFAEKRRKHVYEKKIGSGRR